jgi:hypothetical protein
MVTTDRRQGTFPNETPNSKHQHLEKFQTSTSKTNTAFHIWNLGDWSFSGVWMLGFGIFKRDLNT